MSDLSRTAGGRREVVSDLPRTASSAKMGAASVANIAPLFSIVFGGLAALLSAAPWLIVAVRFPRRLPQIQGSSPLGP